MKKMLTVIVSLFLLTTASNADLRVLNGTGRPIEIGLMTQAGQVQKFTLPYDKVISKPLGEPKSEDYEVLIVYGQDGSEKLRDNVQTGHVQTINDDSFGLRVQPASRFRGKPIGSGKPWVINSTGHKLQYVITYPDYGPWEDDGGSLTKPTTVTFDELGKEVYEGDEMPVTFDVPGAGKVSGKVKAGHVYHLTVRDGQALLELVH